ncbi:DivIVA domain-containing protein [Micromonospora sp. WMMD714]|uniref:DivIVA domain-containing protein n=1 Tax=Micromonospora sp. WMMD714 TaxID=3016097 RepID=UPI00249B66B8|nr:DivIVA domain-containing protein [Micromonospora sp. WMMD714]WFE65521.1 DivIVA domain-containing protein [Micromonospora sp. WMMD714]
MAQVYRGGQPYGTGHPALLTPHEVRTHEFPPRRHGVDPDEVRRFQSRLADELAALYQEIRVLAQENDRLRRALHDWQTRPATQTRQATQPRQTRQYPPRNGGRW